MIEPKDRDDEAALPPDRAPDNRPESRPQSSKPPRARRGDVQVYPLDEDKHIEDGIEVDEK